MEFFEEGTRNRKSAKILFQLMIRLLTVNGGGGGGGGWQHQRDSGIRSRQTTFMHNYREDTFRKSACRGIDDIEVTPDSGATSKSSTMLKPTAS